MGKTGQPLDEKKLFIAVLTLQLQFWLKLLQLKDDGDDDGNSSKTQQIQYENDTIVALTT